MSLSLGGFVVVDTVQVLWEDLAAGELYCEFGNAECVFMVTDESSSICIADVNNGDSVGMLYGESIGEWVHPVKVVTPAVFAFQSLEEHEG